MTRLAKNIRCARRTAGSLLGMVLLVLGLLALSMRSVPLSHAADQEEPETTTVEVNPPESVAADHTVRLHDMEFVPNRIEVEAGQRILFVNRDPFKHDIYLVNAANQADVIVPATDLQGEHRALVTLRRDGVFNLYCTIHGGMSGKLTTTGSFELTEAQKKAAAARQVLPPEAKQGKNLFWGAAQCHQCHSVGEKGDGLRGPNLEQIGFRAEVRAEDLGLASGTEYIMQSLAEPSAHVVEGYTDDMPRVYQPPIDLGQDELTAVVAYLQSLGGQVDTWAIDLDVDGLPEAPAYNPFAGGDPETGAAIFRDNGCIKCHRVPGHDPVSVGPDLTEIGNVRPWTWLIRSILDPDEEVGVNWRSVTLHLAAEEGDDGGGYGYGGGASGESVRGVLRGRDAETVRLLVAGGKTRTFQTDRIDRIEEEEGSRMPGNYDELLTYRQMADLVAYLQGLRGNGASATP